MGSVVITGNGGGAITPQGVQVSLPDTDVVFKYDTATHTITIEGAEFARFSDDIKSNHLFFRQDRNAAQEIVLLHPDWPGFKG
ncbi:hypothetical protein [Mycobacterium phage CELFI]|uniref:Uncharacterized protein n=1 Tax=Mycobacterium phage CELFI TaxID=2769359 RepID=A0A7G9V496_9CAUD|nr:hypothetical protein J4T95_gp074 [Mycobacterium phage CELFI]QNO01102.1 hypothetical protein [Mycobacterium phage CELFI]